MKFGDEPKRMTNRQLSEWLAKGNGQMGFPTQYSTAVYNEYGQETKREISSNDFMTFHSYDREDDNKEVNPNIRIRPWGSNEWIVPTEDIHIRDCKNK